MAYADATSAQTLALRNAMVNGTKWVERVQEGGQSNAETLGPTVDTYLEPVVAAISDVGVSSGDVALVPDSFALTDVTPSGTYTDTVTFTVEDGAITAIVLS